MRIVSAVLTTIWEVVTAPFRLISRIFGGRGRRRTT
jgi:hypothetical protein